MQNALRSLIAAAPLRELVPELDWGVMHPDAAERRALEVLADALERRALPLPGLAARAARSAPRACPPPPRPRPNGRKIVLTSFGFNDSRRRHHRPARGRQGARAPRLGRHRLPRRRRGPTHRASPTPCASGTRTASTSSASTTASTASGTSATRCASSTTRRSRRPSRALLDRVRPDVVHFHNLHNLGAALIDEAAARGLPSYFSTHNYWLICPRAYLLTGAGAICGGPGDRGRDCASCVGAPHDTVGHQQRLEGIRDRFTRGVSVCLAVSDAMRSTLAGQDYPADMIDVVQQAVPAADEVWERLGRDRRPGRTGERLTVAFFGSAYPHKGPQLLIEAAQRTGQELRVLIHGEVDERFARQLRAADARGVVELCGAFGPAELPELLAGVDVAVMPSLWWDCAPLMAAECLAGRVPLVAPRLGGLGEAVRHEVDGLLFDGLDAGDLARQLDRLADEPGLLERLQAGIEAPRPFAEYVDELEAYYAGRAPVARAAGDRRPGHHLAGRPRPAHEPLAHQQRGHRAPGARPAPGPLAARRSTRRCPTRPTSRCATSGRPTCARRARGAWPSSSPGSSARSRPSGSSRSREDVDEVWVPSGYVRDMYLRAGLDDDRVHVVPNGVDLERFAPDGPAYALDAPAALRFLFVGGAIGRKGVDVLLAAWQQAFAGRDDVQLVIKDFGSDGVYRGADRSAVHALAQTPARSCTSTPTSPTRRWPRSTAPATCSCIPIAARASPCRCSRRWPAACPSSTPPAARPTSSARRRPAGASARSAGRCPAARVDHLETVGEPWMLEPDAAHLAELLREAADAGAEDRARRGALGRSAALHFGWDRVAALYAERAARPGRPRAARARRTSARSTAPPPSWPRRPGAARTTCPRCCAAWTQAPAGACLYLLADPATDGDARRARGARDGRRRRHRPRRLRRHRDPARVRRPRPRRGAARRRPTLYVPLHDACAGHLRLAGAERRHARRARHPAGRPARHPAA